MAKSTSTPSTVDVRLVRLHPTNPIVATATELPVPFIEVCFPRYTVIRGMAAHRLDLGAVLEMPEGVVAQAFPDAADAHLRGYQVTSGVVHGGQEVTIYIRSLTPRSVEFNEGAPIARLYFSRDLLSVAVEV